MELCERLRLVTVPNIQDVLLSQMLERPAKLMWEHNGKCICGRRTFLHGLCDKCAREDAIDRHQAAAQEPDAEDAQILDDPDATLDLAVTDPATLESNGRDASLSASLWPASTPVYLTDECVAKLVSVFYMDEESWSEVFVSASFTFAPAAAMLWTGTKIEQEWCQRRSPGCSCWCSEARGPADDHRH